jgi:hypothetical protein
MFIRVQRPRCAAALLAVLLPALRATTIPRLTFEQLTDSSEVIASGRVTRTWAAWDSEHKYIWTHYTLNVTQVAKGAPGASVEFAEPGGAIGDAAMVIAGTVTYGIGENVAVFLSRMPNGYLRTAGWSQGKYDVDAAGRLHGSGAIGAQMIEANARAKTAQAGTSLTTLNSMSFNELKQRVAARVRATAGNNTGSAR